MNRQEYDSFCYMDANNTFPEHEGKSYSWFMQQHQEEFWLLLEKLQLNNTRTILEVGSAAGGTLPFFGQIADKVVGLSLDTPTAFTAITYSKNNYPNISYIKANSHLNSTLELVKKQQPFFDTLFIDGDHTYEGTKQDFEMYSPLIKRGGIIAFHDVAIELGVKKFFEEITLRKELLKVYYMGIGIAYNI